MATGGPCEQVRSSEKNDYVKKIMQFLSRLMAFVVPNASLNRFPIAEAPIRFLCK